jgi:mono/diheme cytochrome c family protein
MRLSALLILVLSGLGSVPWNGPGSAENSLVRAERSSRLDLEIAGNIPGLRAGYIRYEDLLALPQVNIQASNDINFEDGTKLSGVYLETLERKLGAADGKTLISAVCDDQYEAHYLVEYRRVHRPILVLKVNDRLPGEWRRGYGPYLITHPSFTPSFRVLSHRDEAQVPYGVIRLEFHAQAEALASIAPRGEFAADAPEMKGFKIAEQNCLRCHYQGTLGGRKGGASWRSLGEIAAGKPKYFDSYIVKPKVENPAATMPAYTSYDEKTRSALIAYFQTFSGGKTR